MIFFISSNRLILIDLNREYTDKQLRLIWLDSGYFRMSNRILKFDILFNHLKSVSSNF